MVCLWEMKPDNIDQFTAAFLGGHRLRSFAQRPANGTRGGILLLWDDLLLEMSNITSTTYCLSAMVHVRDSGVRFKITTVYGPTDPSLKDAFFVELISQKPPVGVAWIASRDFNQIYRARDKKRGTLTPVESTGSVQLSIVVSLKKSTSKIGGSPGASRDQTQP